MTKAAEIAEQMPLGKATVDKLEAIEDNKKIGGCGKSHQSKDGINVGDVQKYCQSADSQGDFAVGLYSRAECLGGPQEWCGGIRMMSI